MITDVNTHRRRQLSQNGSEVQSRINALQDANRLGLTVFEQADETRLFPKDLWKDLRFNEQALAQARTRDVDKKDVAVMSLSHAPSRRSGKSIVPFTPDVREGHTLGYIFGLDTARENPASVVRVTEKIFNTGYNRRDKDFLLTSFRMHPHFKSFYGPYMHEHNAPDKDVKECALLNASLRAPGYFNGVLDTLGGMYEHESHDKTSEVLATVAPHHLEAIVMSIGRNQKRPYSSRGMDAFMDRTDELKAALSGLAHLKEGVDVPVMLYHVGGKERGQFTYLAQGYDECRNAALHAIDRIQRSREFKSHDVRGALPQMGFLQEQARELLDGIDILQPLEQQGISLPHRGMGL